MVRWLICGLTMTLALLLCTSVYAQQKKTQYFETYRAAILEKQDTNTWEEIFDTGGTSVIVWTMDDRIVINSQKKIEYKLLRDRSESDSLKKYVAVDDGGNMAELSITYLKNGEMVLSIVKPGDKLMLRYFIKPGI